MLNTLRRRFILSHTLTPFVIVPLLALALVYVIESRVLLPDIARELREQAQLVVQLTNDNPDIWTRPDEAQALVNRIEPGVSALVMLLDRDGHILASSDPDDVQRIGTSFGHPGLAAVLAGQINEHSDYNPRLVGQAADIFIPVMGPDHQVIGVVRMAHLVGTVYDQFLRVRYSVVATMGLALILGTLVGLILAMNLARPLREVSGAISRMASGQELATVPEQGPKEIQQVVQAFNLLMKRLRTLQESRRQLLANTVHELSTPLGALDCGVQALQEGAAEEPELRRELLQGMNAEIRRLEHLLSDLTDLYDQALGTIQLARQALAPSEWLARVLPVWREAALRKGLQWQAAIAPNLPGLQADPERLTQILGNLLTNAIKYTDKGGSVTVTTGVEKNEVWISVTDTGRGIPLDEQDKIFIPFFRGRHAGRFPEGMGLGLPIARELAEAHGGRLEVQSSPGKGSRFILWLPA